MGSGFNPAGQNGRRAAVVLQNLCFFFGGDLFQRGNLCYRQTLFGVETTSILPCILFGPPTLMQDEWSVMWHEFMDQKHWYLRYGSMRSSKELEWLRWLWGWNMSTSKSNQTRWIKFHNVVIKKKHQMDWTTSYIQWTLTWTWEILGHTWSSKLSQIRVHHPHCIQCYRFYQSQVIKPRHRRVIDGGCRDHVWGAEWLSLGCLAAPWDQRVHHISSE